MTTCLACGAPFTGRPNRKYCNAACKQVETRRRQRVVELTAALAVYERQARVAELSGNKYAAREYRWHVAHCRTLLDEIGSIGTKTDTVKSSTSLS
jgi:hypothetical protein